LLLSKIEGKEMSPQWQRINLLRDSLWGQLRDIRGRYGKGWLSRDEAEGEISSIEAELSFSLDDPTELGILGTPGKGTQPVGIETAQRLALDECAFHRRLLDEDIQAYLFPERIREVRREVDRMKQTCDYSSPEAVVSNFEQLRKEGEGLVGGPRGYQGDAYSRIGSREFFVGEILARISKDVDERKISPEAALSLVDKWMRLTDYQCFDVAGWMAIDQIAEEASWPDAGGSSPDLRASLRAPVGPSTRLRSKARKEPTGSHVYIRCSICGRIQRENRRRCIHCGAGFE
jgi:hypothetical protein